MSDYFQATKRELFFKSYAKPEKRFSRYYTAAETKSNNILKF